MGINENEGVTADAKTVTVMEIHPNFQDGNGNGNLGQKILKKNKTAGNSFDSNGNTKKSLKKDLWCSYKEPPFSRFCRFLVVEFESNFGLYLAGF